jgi:hypothetical protein
MKKIQHGLYILVIFMITACESTNNSVLGTSETQVQMRNYQSRSFDTGDKKAVLRSIISTMQDLGFIINRADEKLGTISGTSFTNSSKLTVSARSSGKSQIIVRANAQVGLNAIDNPRPYQNFFNALSQSLFLDANAVE